MGNNISKHSGAGRMLAEAAHMTSNPVYFQSKMVTYQDRGDTNLEPVKNHQLANKTKPEDAGPILGLKLPVNLLFYCLFSQYQES